MDKLKKVLRRDSDDDEKSKEGLGIMERANEASRLTWGKRMKAFVVCFVLGIVFCFLSVSLLWIPGVTAGLFAAFYTAGNVFALISITFLIGPCEQLKSMFAKERALATILMLVCMVLTVLAAFLWKSAILGLLFCGIQFLAFTWYCLSYIPYVRDAIIKVCRFCC